MTPKLPGSVVCAIFDLDGTLADIEHRRHYIDHTDYASNGSVTSTSSRWAAFFAAMPQDTVIQPMRTLFWSLQIAGTSALICTGRGEETRAPTEAWLAHHGIQPSKLYMRPAGDFREDSIVKGEMLDAIRVEGWRPYIVFEDRQRVVDMWRARGLLCAQVAKGDY